MPKKTLLLFASVVLLFLAMHSLSFAQELYFCEGVSDDGKPIGSYSTFNIPSGGGYFYFLVNLPYEIGCYSVAYDIYKIDDYGNATYNTTIYQDDLQKNWVWFRKKVTFYQSGYYRVDVVDCYEYLLARSYLTVKFK